MTIAMIIAFLWAMSCLAYDSYMSDKGIRLGLALEGNRMITWIAGTMTPKFWQLYSIDAGLIRIPIFLLCLFLPAPSAYPETWHAFGIGAFISIGIKNILGGLKWRKLMRQNG